MGKGHKRPATPSPATPPLELPLEDTAPGPPAPDAGPDGMSGPGLTPGVLKNGPQKWKKAQQVNHQVEREAGWPDGRTVQGVSTTPKVKIKMKKLMIALAAAGLVGGAFASCDKPATPTPKNCAEVYDVVFNLKTTKCKCTTVTSWGNGGNECGKPTKGDAVKKCVAWREIVSKKVNGVIWNCDCSCSADLDKDSILEITPVIWDLVTDPADAAGNQYFWIAKDKWVLDSLMEFSFLGRISKGNKKVEAYGAFGAISFAGFGTYDVKNTRVAKISGNAAGFWGAPYDCSSWEDNDYTEDCPAYQLCDATAALEDYSTTAAYGTFSVKYNAAKSKKLAAGYLVGPVIPKAVLGYTQTPNGGKTYASKK